MASPASPIIVHHLNNSRSQRILWLLEELQLPYEIKRYQRNEDQRAPKELEQVHPLGKSPVITDGRHTIAESGAILEYLVETYGNGRLRPAAGTDERILYTYWLHFAEGTTMPPLLMTLVFAHMQKSVPRIVKPVTKAISNAVHEKVIDPDLTRIFNYIEKVLTEHEWFAGNEFTAADIQMSFPLEAASNRAPQFLGPKTKAFLTKIHDMPGYKKALEKGGKYDYA
ncbi:hypothetical protein SpCBS45565_g04817 [Spizellomyces sp. 'palustris']|nr:hypothetical protein SpCBS45565_g04817 [Spizellomyces sp. 'palustris']